MLNLSTHNYLLQLDRCQDYENRDWKYLIRIFVLEPGKIFLPMVMNITTDITQINDESNSKICPIVYGMSDIQTRNSQARNIPAIINNKNKL